MSSLRFNRVTPAEVHHVPDDAVLTQYGALVHGGQTSFRSKPRHPNESDISLLEGRLTVSDAALAVRHRAAVSGDRVRYVFAASLRKYGFRVTHTPSRMTPNHVSVTVPGGAVEWDNEQQEAFEKAFQEYGKEQ